MIQMIMQRLLTTHLIVLLFFRVTLTLVATLVTAIVVAQLVLQPAMRVLANNASHELYQLALVSFCLLCAMVTGYLVCEVGVVLLVHRLMHARHHRACQRSWVHSLGVLCSPPLISRKARCTQLSP